MFSIKDLDPVFDDEGRIVGVKNHEAFSAIVRKYLELIQTGSSEDLSSLSCPLCGSSIEILWIRAIIPLIGSGSVSFDCTNTKCFFSTRADGNGGRPPWVGRFKLFAKFRTVGRINAIQSKSRPNEKGAGQIPL